MTAAADHLLFGLLALETGLIDQSALIAAFRAWTRDKTTALADHLLARGNLDADDRAALDALVTRSSIGTAATSSAAWLPSAPALQRVKAWQSSATPRSAQR